jgi:magnesium transporter
MCPPPPPDYNRGVFRVLDVPLNDAGAGGEPASCELIMGLERVAPPPEGVLRWIDLDAQDEADLLALGEKFQFHPLALEDCAHFDQRPKLEEYGGYLFIVVHGLIYPKGNPREVEARELHAFLGDRFLVTIHADPIPSLETVWRRICGDLVLARRGADFIYYLIVDDMVESNFDMVDVLSETIEEIDDAIVNRSDPSHIQDIFAIKRSLVSMRKVLSPQRDVFAMLAKRGDPRISERTSIYFRDVYDHLVRIYESIDTARDLLGNALDAHLSMVANRTNEIMKRLTVLSAIFLPLAFLTGFFGQNFPLLSHDYFLGVVVAVTVLLPPGMLWYFKRAKWL